MKAQHLIGMANDIARNLTGEADEIGVLVNHLEMFWAPKMRRQLVDALASDPGDALPTVTAAVARLGRD